MFFPMLKGTRLQRVTETKLPGLDRRESAATPGFREMENLCSEGYPALRTRPGRGLVETLKKPNGLLAKDALLWVDGKHLYMNGLEVGPELTDGEKSLVSMGAYVVVFPDKVYVNTQDVTDCGSLECERTAPAGSGLALCDETGTAYSGVTESAGAPEEPREGALWLDLSGTEPVLRQYSREVWTALEGVCVKVQATGIGTGFAAGDGVEVSGCSVARLNGETVLQAADTDWVAFPGTVAGGAVTETAMKLRRFVPEMDYVVQSGNRLWGCKYGMVDGKPVNEIYASKLGDCKNWRCFAGLATDSYAAARGSDGVFTGAVSYLGNPIFFKERCMERVYASGSGAHQIVTTECSGVQKGSARSLQVVGGVLYYLSGDGVQAFDGSLPVCVSQALGAERYHGGVAGCWQEKYYLSALDREEKPSLLVYDSARQLWHREDALRAVDFAGKGTELYALGADGKLWSLHGQSGQAEETFSWQVETGEMGMQSPERKRLTQLFLYLRPEKGQAVTAWVSYDQGETWIRQGQIVGSGGIREQAIAIRPRQCRRLRLRLTGSGQCTLYALTALYEKGSDGL
ncbi:hypothetical protein MM35RIKEN_22130 (plasmid) [Vescimonas fastidiosa]|uniref:Uncharacterized protein n=1 Tax=Vescimonas fastidiosa TaxID=2714353 RepID=A0A810Q3J4_9FIRM|nr:hypothetical protein [Vescimonas fastidiosa]BCK80021.1 hypothetical protein MM35RIKEN_22130 [Vescimonas fastidiosa]